MAELVMLRPILTRAQMIAANMHDCKGTCNRRFMMHALRDGKCAECRSADTAAIRRLKAAVAMGVTMRVNGTEATHTIIQR